MFLNLLLGAALAWMPILIQSQVIGYQSFSPNVPENIINTTFPVDLKTATTYDILLVKCPYLDYKHNEDSDFFRPESKIEKSKIEGLILQSRTLIWTTLLRGLSNSTHFICGQLTRKTDGTHYDVKVWSYNVMWEKPSSLYNSTELKHTKIELERTFTQCNNGQEDPLILTKKKENNMIVPVNYANIDNSYVNQIFYYFKKPKANDVSLIQESCATVKIYHDCPEIILTDYNPPQPKIKDNITVINVNGKEEIIKVILNAQGDTNYFRGEEIYLKKMRYLKNGPEVIEETKTSITSEFSIKGFDLVELTYNCPYKGSLTLITRKIYFAPSSNDHKINEKTVKYFKNETSRSPNCPLFYLNIGYLYKFKYNVTERDYNNTVPVDSIKEISSKTESHIFFNGTEDPHLTISCFYKTLDGSITTTTEFVDLDKKAWIAKMEKDKVLDEARRNEANQKAKEEANKKKLEKEREEESKKNQKEKDEIKKMLEEKNKSWYQKLSEKVGKTSALLLIVGIILIILIILAVLLVIINKKWMGPLVKMLKNKKKHPNVYAFWNNLTRQPFENYCSIIKDPKYLSNKVLNLKVLKTIEGDEEIDVDFNDVFDLYLVRCYNNMSVKIQAHYVYTDTEKRRYILSDGPTIHNHVSFWQMIYEEDIGTIVAIIYNKDSENSDEALKDLYWKNEKCTYEDIDVTCLNKIKVNVLSVSGYKLLLEKKGGESKSLEIYHVYNWKGNEIPHSDLQFVSIYQEIIKDAPKKNILIHSSRGTGARVYMLTYFLCTYDAMKSDNNIDCPMKVVKGIRERRQGGNLVPYEFAYIVKALVTAFFNNKILIDFSQRRTDFISSYENYFYDYLKRKDQMDDEVKEFLNFVNIVDVGRIYEYKTFFYKLGRIDPKILPNHCKRFQKAVDNFQNGKDVKKCRYKDVQCLDVSAVTVNGKPGTDKDSFIHANKFEYTTINNKTRKMILCQSPLDDTVDDMLDMILRYKVTVVVILMKPDETNVPEKKWVPYFPERHHTFETQNFAVSRLKFKELDENLITETECHLKSKKGLGIMNFTIIHYQGWPDKSIPSENRHVRELYSRIISLRTDDYIAIHCSSGVGRTGTLALIMYLIDTINFFPTFDPIARLKCLRDHRYLAVQSYNQFVYALMFVYGHYSKQINAMDEGAYERFSKMAYELFDKEKALQDKQNK
uniref:Tyrosine-protein phosphatase domain-containing protein n=1 Tax=Strongyloides papillosus TaxID=174720 RepID=A0A0N5C6C8_STREA